MFLLLPPLLPPLPPTLAQALMLPDKPVTPFLGGKAVVKFRASQGTKTTQRLKFFAYYPDAKGTGPGEPYPNVTFLPEELLVPPGGRPKTARASFDLSSLTREQKIFICAKTLPKQASAQAAAGQAGGVATLSVLSCWPLRLAPGKQ